ncbi:hypothetical protein Vafri_18951 [Volvox africanus]|uniref:Uncharacterized protein n=1 Tax=Volvox africanus TaxID=51714 RepID=A0A8J4BNK6_9CHLO|nr:hypothetical protein Vafri_18951 [Volvox africanus]
MHLKQHECRVHELLGAKHRAAGAATAALREAAFAIRACPYDRAAWALLSHTSVQDPGLQHAVLAARVAPRARAPYMPESADENAAPSLAAPPTLVPSAAAAHAAGLTATAAAAAAKVSAGTSGIVLLAAVQEAAVRLRRVVHAQPHEASAWYLCALTELQHAIASGGQARLYRSAAVAANTAAVRAKAELAALPTEPPPPPPSPLTPGLSPALALAMAAQTARTHAAAAAGATDPRVTALRTQRLALADVRVRSLAVLSECRLQLQLRGHGVGVGGDGDGDGDSDGDGVGQQMGTAREAAAEALSVATSYGVDASPAHRQLARLHVAQGDLGAANTAYKQACRAAAAAASGSSSRTSYELLPALEWAAVQAAAGETAAAVQLLTAVIENGADSGGVTVPARPVAAASLVNIAAVQHALLLLQLGEMEAAVAAAAAAAATRQYSQSLRSSAHVVQAAAALMQATLAEGDGGGVGSGSNTTAVRRKSLLEARWAALEALKPLSLSRPAGHVGQRGSAPPPGPMGPCAALAAVLLSAAEAGLGKESAARDLHEQAARLWPHQALEPLETFTRKSDVSLLHQIAVQSESSSSWSTSTTTASAATPAFTPPRMRGGAGGAAGAAGGGGGGGSTFLVRAMHCRPWAFKAEWSVLAAAARAT